MRRFQSRKEAGALLGDKLVSFQSDDPLILAVPRGGVPVAYEVAKKLGSDLDLLMVKKIGAPENPELAIGAVSEDGRPWYNNKIVGQLGIKTAALKSLADAKAIEVKKQISKLRGTRPAIPVEGRNLILIDDGVATGATLLAAVNLLRARKPKRIVIATPVGPASTFEELRKVADEVVSLETPSPFVAVGDWYHQFPQVLDEEVLQILQSWDPEQMELALKVKPLFPSLENVVREIQDLAYPIQRAGGWDELITTIAKSKVVMLGEATHGTSEFYSIRRMISERLIRDHGFDFIAVEGDWPDCQKLNDYIRSGKGKSAKEVMRHFHRWPTWMWANDETAALIEWMQSFQAGFYGLDVYSLFDSMDYVKSYVARLDPDLARVMSGRYACFESFHRNEKLYAQHLTKFNDGCRAEVIQNLRQLLRLRLEDFGLKNGDLFSAQQNARIVKNADDYYRAMISGGPESWNIRDQHMLETLDLLLHRGGQERKGIVWAHNSHIGDYHATDMLEEGYVNLGGLAREKFGVEHVALVGFGTYQGEVLASPAWEGPETITSLPAARESSFEYYCHEATQTLQTQRFYLIFDPAARKTVLGTRQYGHRAVGVVYHPRFETHGRNYVPTKMAQRYDAFVYVDKTSALRSIPTLTTVKELPETWPGGM